MANGMPACATDREDITRPQIEERRTGRRRRAVRLSGLALLAGAVVTLGAAQAALAAPPSVVTEVPSSLTSSSATLNGTVNPHGERIEVCDFSYEPVEPLQHGGQAVQCSQSSITGEEPIAVSAPLVGLFEGITYRYELSVLTSSLEQQGGGFQEFTVPPIPTGPRPSVSKVLAKKGPAAGGTPVTITGTHFTGVTSVWFGTAKATSVAVTSETSITTVAPASASGLSIVRVTTADGGTSFFSNHSIFTYGAPTVTGVSPSDGPIPGGTLVTVTGTGFVEGEANTRFDFGRDLVDATDCASPTTCTVVSPPGTRGKTQTVAVRAVVAHKTSKKNPSDEFTYTSG
jgi:hypothetical protein